MRFLRYATEFRSACACLDTPLSELYLTLICDIALCLVSIKSEHHQTQLPIIENQSFVFSMLHVSALMAHHVDFYEDIKMSLIRPIMASTCRALKTQHCSYGRLIAVGRRPQFIKRTWYYCRNLCKYPLYIYIYVYRKAHEMSYHFIIPLKL